MGADYQDWGIDVRALTIWRHILALENDLVVLLLGVLGVTRSVSRRDDLF